MAAQLYIGLMSGTSLDGVDAVLASFARPADQVKLLAHHHRPFEPQLRETLLSLNTSGPNELHRAALAANALSRAYAETVDTLLCSAEVDRSTIVALGAHGQTVRHRPGEFDGCGYTLQLINGALLAELSGIDTIVDFRSRDLAAGGQGAPLVPAFHQALFGQSGQALAVLNIGGIANLSLLDGHGRVLGFDCGPGNALLDHWCQRHLGKDFDAGGEWAAGGDVLPWLLQALLAEPYFDRVPPKSTGRDLFNAGWLQARLDAESEGTQYSPRNVQATLTELTAQAIAAALRLHQPNTTGLLVCGGGALNHDLMRRLTRQLGGICIEPTTLHGIPPMQVEAFAFAWLAQRFCLGLPANSPEVTGAKGARIIGCRYPA